MLGFSSEQTMSIAQKLYEGTNNPDPDGGTPSKLCSSMSTEIGHFPSVVLSVSVQALDLCGPAFIWRNSLSQTLKSTKYWLQALTAFNKAPDGLIGSPYV